MWHSLKNLLWKTRGVWITTPSVTLLVLILRFAGFLQPWEWELYDSYMRLRPPEAEDNRIAVIGINEDDLHNLNESVISDEKLAELLNKVKKHQPSAIGLDMYRDLPVPPGSEKLNEVFGNTPNLIGIQKVAGELGRETVAPSPILQEKGQIGANDLIFDGDNRIRRGLIYLQDASGNPIYSLSIYLALLYLQKEGVTLQPIKGTDNWKLGKSTFTPLETNDGGYIRADAGGFQVLINYRGGDRFFETVSMTDILNDRVSADWGKDKIILIGKVGESFKDLFFTPYRGGLLQIPKPTAGVEIHANLTSQILSSALESRPLMRTVTEWQEGVWILFWSGLGAVISWQFRYNEGKKYLSLLRWGSVLLAGGILFVSTYYAFVAGWWIPVVPALLAFGGSTIAITAYIARMGIEIRKTFGRYLTDQVVANLLENPTGQELGGIRKKITILTSDLRGFTAISERLPPEEVIKILNFYLGYMADIITKHEGTIDEFMGDGILVLFGAPTSKPDDSERAIACAIEMQQVMKTVNEQMKVWDLPKLDMGIGINTGEVVVGNIGSEKRTKYGIVGSQVNLTYRVESYTTGGQILISESTYKEVERDLIINGTKEVQPKGIPHPITVYDVGGIKGDFNLILEQEIEQYLPLNDPIALQYRIVQGKDIDESVYYGRLVELSEKGGLIVLASESDSVPPPLTNLKINFLMPHESPAISEDIYGKVLEKNSKKGSFYLYFTAKPPDISKKLEKLYQTL